MPKRHVRVFDFQVEGPEKLDPHIDDLMDQGYEIISIVAISHPRNFGYPYTAWITCLLDQPVESDDASQ